MDYQKIYFKLMIIFCFVLIFSIPVVSFSQALPDISNITELANALDSNQNKIKIEAGYKFDFINGSQDDKFYRIQYNGKLLSDDGELFKRALGLDLDNIDASEVIDDLGADAKEARSISIRAEEGLTDINGGFIEAIGLKPITLAGLEKIGLRGTAFLASDTDFENLQFAAGIESRSFSIPLARDLGASNWFVFGINAQRTENSETPEDDNFGLATYRAFIGKHLLWSNNYSVDITNKIVEEILSTAPTYDSAVSIVRDFPAPINRTEIQVRIVDMIGEVERISNNNPNREKNDIWKDVVQDMGRGAARAISKQPLLSLYFESSGWYELKGTSDKEFRNLITASLDYWFLPGRQDTYLRFRYENGYERGQPTIKKNHMMISFGFVF